METAIEQIKKCQFRDKMDHPLEKNVGFIELVKLAKLPERKIDEDKLQQLIIELVYEASDGGYKIGKDQFTHFEENIRPYAELLKFIVRI